MVTQRSQAKTSSVGEEGKGAYAFRSVIRADWQLPMESELGSLVQKNLNGGLDHYFILGKAGNVRADAARWKEPPHRRFVNLPISTTPAWGMEIVDPKAMLAFSKHYGFFPYADIGAIRNRVRSALFRSEGLKEREAPKSEFVMRTESSASLAVISKDIEQYGSETFSELLGSHSQAILKYAWRTGDVRVLEEIATYNSRGLQGKVDVTTGSVVIRVGDAWNLICMLLVRDHAAGRTAVCANPECPAPYFLKSRKTQRICETGECVAWAQRNYARKWWRENESKASNAKLKGKTK